MYKPDKLQEIATNPRGIVVKSVQKGEAQTKLEEHVATKEKHKEIQEEKKEEVNERYKMFQNEFGDIFEDVL